MKKDVYAINRQVKGRALEALTGNFFSILKILTLPTVLMFVLNMTGNEYVAGIGAVVSGFLMLGFFPYASTLMSLQERQPLQAREYAKSWSWFALFTVWRNRLAMGVDYLIFAVIFTLLGFGSLFGLFIPAILMGALLDGFAFAGLIIAGVMFVAWLVLVIWVSIKLGFVDYVFSDAIFGDMDTTAFNDVDFSRMTMWERLKTIIRTTWTLMTWNVFWRWVWLLLTFIGWGLLGLVTLGIGFLFVGPYMTMANVAFYEQIVGEKYGTTEEIEVVTITTEVEVDVLEPK